MLIKDLISHATIDMIREWKDELEDSLNKLDQEEYSCLFDDLYELVYGEILSNDKAEKLVHAMKPYGQKWTMAEAEQALKGQWKESTKYYTMNMMYNDYKEMFGDSTEKYIEMSKLWLDDIDSDGGDIKTYRYATRV